MISTSTIVDQMTTIPAGSLVQRDDRLGKSWVVQISSFLICQYPVTQSLFRDVMGTTPSTFGPVNDYPVETVSWLAAAQFCNRLSDRAGLAPRYRLTEDGDDAEIDAASCGYRLPTEAEWEFACRAGTQGPRYGAIEAIAWYRDTAPESPQPVGLKQPNDWGLHDMLGNVWEWCEDIYDPEVYGRYRIFRGGGWADQERGCLVTNRRRSHPTYAIDDLGFRIARSLPST